MAVDNSLVEKSMRSVFGKLTGQLVTVWGGWWWGGVGVVPALGESNDPCLSSIKLRMPPYPSVYNHLFAR